PFVDTTADLPGRARADVILDWVRRHPDVERFIVIDDEDDELDALPLFQPLRSTGLTDEIVEGAADYLNGKTDKDMRRNKLVRVFSRSQRHRRGPQGLALRPEGGRPGPGDGEAYGWFAAKVSHCFVLPVSSPRLNQRTRCA